LNDKLLEKIQQVQTLKQQLRGFTQDLDNRQKQLKKIVDIQTRLRENIRSLEKVKSDKLIARYMDEFETQEDQLMTIYKDMEDLAAKKTDINDSITKVNKEIQNIATESVT